MTRAAHAILAPLVLISVAVIAVAVLCASVVVMLWRAIVEGCRVSARA